MGVVALLGMFVLDDIRFMILITPSVIAAVYASRARQGQRVWSINWIDLVALAFVGLVTLIIVFKYF
jgi:hypothetical protein